MTNKKVIRAKEIRRDIVALDQNIDNLNGRCQVMLDQERELLSSIIEEEKLLSKSTWRIQSSLTSITSVLLKKEFEDLIDMIKYERSNGEEAFLDELVLQKSVTPEEEEEDIVLYIGPTLTIVSQFPQQLLEFIDKHQLIVDSEVLIEQRDNLVQNILLLEDLIKFSDENKEKIEEDKKKEKLHLPKMDGPHMADIVNLLVSRPLGERDVALKKIWTPPEEDEED